MKMSAHFVVIRELDDGGVLYRGVARYKGTQPPGSVRLAWRNKMTSDYLKFPFQEENFTLTQYICMY